MKTQSHQPGQRWLLAHTLGIAFSLSHVMLDLWAGVVGPLGVSLTGSGVLINMTASQVLILVSCAVVYALWAYTLGLGSLGRRGALWATLATLGVLSSVCGRYSKSGPALKRISSPSTQAEINAS